MGCRDGKGVTISRGTAHGGIIVMGECHYGV